MPKPVVQKPTVKRKCPPLSEADTRYCYKPQTNKEKFSLDKISKKKDQKAAGHQKEACKPQQQFRTKRRHPQQVLKKNWNPVKIECKLLNVLCLFRMSEFERVMLLSWLNS